MTRYMAGKGKIGKELAWHLENSEDNQHCTAYLEPFCGMCGVTKHMAKTTPSGDPWTFRHCSDVNGDVIAFWHEAQEGRVHIPAENPGRDEFLETGKRIKKRAREITGGENMNPYVRPSEERAEAAGQTFVGHCLGFGGNWYSGFDRESAEDPEHLHRAAARVRVAGAALSDAEFRAINYQEAFRLAKEQWLRQHDGPIPPGSILVYCDPPYVPLRGNSIPNDLFTRFDSEAFWDFVTDADPCFRIYVSELVAPPEKHQDKWRRWLRIPLKRTVAHSKQQFKHEAQELVFQRVFEGMGPEREPREKPARRTRPPKVVAITKEDPEPPVAKPPTEPSTESQAGCGSRPAKKMRHPRGDMRQPQGDMGRAEHEP